MDRAPLVEMVLLLNTSLPTKTLENLMNNVRKAQRLERLLASYKKRSLPLWIILVLIMVTLQALYVPSLHTSAASVVLVGAGDIASCAYTTDTATAKLLDSISGTVFTTGDNVYPDGTYTQYTNCYHSNWGRHKSRTKPSPGNHEYNTSRAAGYFQYFGNIPSYYAYTIGDWRVYALNSNIDVSATSAQVNWLKDDLARNPKKCVLAYWHHPRWSSGAKYGNNSKYQTLWKTLYDAGAELVLNGHEHHYERFKQMNASGSAVSKGLREIVVGTGGAGLYGFGTIRSASEVRSSSTHGVLKLTLGSTSYSWNFIPVAGKTFRDSGTTSCR
jgi:acid phosphatase type 7